MLDLQKGKCQCQRVNGKLRLWIKDNINFIYFLEFLTVPRMHWLFPRCIEEMPLGFQIQVG